MSAERYDPVNAAWQGRNVPPITAHEATRAAAAIVRKFGRRDLGGPHMRYDMQPPRVRRCWISRKGGAKLASGWPRLVHDLSHMIFRKRMPGTRPHHGLHARLEHEITEYVLASGWLDGKLRKAVKPKPTADEKRDARKASLLARLASWTTKQKRATNAMRKVRRQLADLERRARAAIVERAAVEIEAATHVAAAFKQPGLVLDAAAGAGGVRKPKARDPRIDSEERDGDGYWIYLKRGYCASHEPGCHTIREDTKREAYAELRNAHRCDCEDCTSAEPVAADDARASA